MMEEAKRLAEEHWSYIEGLLNLHEVAGRKVIGWHYKAAFVHGYKHGAGIRGREEVLVTKGDNDELSDL